MDSNNKTGRIILALCLTALIGAATFHHTSALGRLLYRGQSVHIVIIGERPTMLSYHPTSRAVDILRLPENALPKLSGTNMNKARAVLRFFIPDYAEGRPVFYIIPPPYGPLQETSYDSWEFCRDWLRSWRSKPGLLWQYYRALALIHSKSLTNITPYDMILCTFEIAGLNISDFRVATLPGERTGKKFISSAAESEILRDRVSTQEPGAVSGVITAEILNATGKPRIALEVTRFLRARDVDVLYFGNHASTEPRTRILDRSGRIEASKKVRDLLELGQLEITSELDKSKSVDVTVILGSDFQQVDSDR